MNGKKTNNIILIGMPGCGKSTVGVVLAKNLGMDFLDVDLSIIRRTGRKLQEILDADGTDAFLSVEADTIQSIDCTGTVIATGGSAVLLPRAAEHLKRLGTLVYLSLPYEAVAARISDLHTRGIAFRAGEDLRSVYESRTPIYRRLADVTICTEGLSLSETVAQIGTYFAPTSCLPTE